MDLLIELLILGVAALVRLVMGKQDPAAAEAAPSPGALPGASADVRRQVESVRDTGEALRADLDDLRNELVALGGPGAALVDIVDTKLVHALDEGLAVIHRSLGSSGDARSDPALGPAVQTVFATQAHTHSLRILARWRGRADNATFLADADAVADALWRRLADHARAHDLAVPTSVPITAPAEPEREAVWFGLLPDDHPVIFVPDDFGEDLLRWPSIAHEVGHVLWQRVPGLPDEAFAATGVGRVTSLPVRTAGGLRGSISSAFAAWLPELFADLVSVFTLGPAAMRGLGHAFATPHRPELAIRARAAASEFEEHPPAHIRMVAAAHLLQHMGHSREAHDLLAGWSQAHGEPDSLILPVAGGGPIRLDIEPFVRATHVLVEQLYQHRWRVLGEMTLADIPGLEMSPGQWARVVKLAHQLADGATPHADPRLLVAAAIEARGRGLASSELLGATLRRAILGRGGHDRPAPDPSYKVPPRVHRLTARQELVAALILREALAGGPTTLRRPGRL